MHTDEITPINRPAGGEPLPDDEPVRAQSVSVQRPARIDHVVIGTRQVTKVMALLRDGHGFGVVQGTSPPDGTQGWLVPFDTPAVQYLEILTPSDCAVLKASDFGRWFLERTADGRRFPRAEAGFAGPGGPGGHRRERHRDETEVVLP